MGKKNEMNNMKGLLKKKAALKADVMDEMNAVVVNVVILVNANQFYYHCEKLR